MTEHRHLVSGQPNNALQLAWCECGQEYDMKRDRWLTGPPKKLEGTIRRAQWHPEGEDA